MNMKKFNINTLKSLKVAALIVIAVFMTSCEKWIDTDLNVDPDSPSVVPNSLLLPTIQQSLGFHLSGNNAVRTTNIWMQMIDGTSRQSFTEARYQLTAADVNTLWGSVYTEVLMNGKILINQAEEQGSPYNAGIAKVLVAYTLGTLTDLYGDIPYSDALNGESNVTTPQYDSQQEIYNSIFTLLDAAIVDLSKDETENLIAVQSDVIYGGDIASWIAAANAIKARHTLQLSKKNGASAYTDALALVGSAIASNAGDMEVPWETANANPIYQFMDQRTDVRMCATLIDPMLAINDPRLPYYSSDLDVNGDVVGYVGSSPGSANEAASMLGSYIAAADAPSVLISFAEMKFIEAEAAFQTGDKDAAVAAYIAGAEASVSKVTGGADNETWLDANIRSATAGSLTLEQIMMQKYYALYAQNQVYADWRRTGFPVLGLAAGATQTEIPRRFPYPQDEKIYNPNTPAVASILVPVWWDE